MDEGNALAHGLQHHQAGRLDEAAAAYELCLRSQPDHAEALCLLGMVALQRGDAANAVVLAGRAVVVQPGNASAHNLLGKALLQQGKVAQAEASFRQVVCLAPGAAEGHHNLGAALLMQKRLAEARSALEQTIRLDPRNQGAFLNLGKTCRAEGNLPAAADCFRKAVELNPNFIEAITAWAEVYGELGQAELAAATWEKAVTLAPDKSLWHRNLADAYHLSGHYAAALTAYSRSLSLDENQEPAWWGLGCVQLALEQYADAAASLARALALDPDHGEARHNLAKALNELGEVDLAVKAYREVLRRHGPNELTLRALATIIPGSPGADHQAVLDARRAWAAQCARQEPVRSFDLAFASTRRPLRLGYVSAHLKHRNWMKPVWALINNHNRHQFEIHLFSDAPESEVEYGFRKQQGDFYHDISGLPNKAAADLIRSEKIDILVDLNGFSKVTRLPLCALRPAPVVAAWFSLYATSGMDCFDALISDEHVSREKEDRFYSESLLRLPGCWLTFQVDYPVPEVTPPPCLLGQPFTFGCLAPQYKIIPEVLDAFAQILRESPGSRLLLKNIVLGQADARHYVENSFARRGIGAERLLLEAPDEHYQFLARYEAVDLALDTFPYNGGTSTTEALWQGVPVLTFYGDRWMARISASIERYAGLDEFVAPDQESFMRQAVSLANDAATPARLAKLRMAMRERLRASTACDAPRYARLMEDAYLGLWAKKRPNF